MLVLGFKAGGMMNLHVEDGVSERAQHWNGDTKGYQIIYAEYFPPTVYIYIYIYMLYLSVSLSLYIYIHKTFSPVCSDSLPQKPGARTPHSKSLSTNKWHQKTPQITSNTRVLHNRTITVQIILLILLWILLYVSKTLVTPGYPTDIVDFGGFDSSIILILRGGNK